MFGPHATHVRISCELTARGGGFRSLDASTLVRQQSDGRFVIGPGKLQHQTRNLVLHVRW